MANLRAIIENAQCDPTSFAVIQRHAAGILTELGISHGEAVKWLAENIQGKRIADLHSWEAQLYSSLNKLGIYERLQGKMVDRAGEWFSKIKPHLLKASTLDLGGGSGEVAKRMQETGCKVTIADVLNWSKYDFPFLQVKDNKMEVPDGAFDQVVLLTVFHHTDNPASLVSETFRVAKKRVVFIESVTEDLAGYSYGAWIDWFYNHVIHYSGDASKKINVPCNFLPATASCRSLSLQGSSDEQLSCHWPVG